MTRLAITAIPLTALLLLAAGAPAAAPARADDLARLWEEGSALFHQGAAIGRDDPDAARRMYAGAAERFERLVVEGKVDHGNLFYNLGNAYFLSGDVGRAILNYRRAQRRLARDPNVRQNLAVARRARVDHVATSNGTRARQTLLFWHYDLTAPTRAALFALSYVLFWAFVAWRLLAPGVVDRWGAPVCLVVSVLMLGSLAADELHARRSLEGVVVDSEVVARQGDGADYEPAFNAPLHAGTEFALVEARQGWFYVQLADGRRCWLPDRSAELVRRDSREEL